MISHPHVTKAWIKWEVNERSPQQVLVIETSLELDSQKEGFNSSELDDLVEFATKEFDRRKEILGRIDIVPAGGT